jgi:5'-nucleotidase
MERIIVDMDEVMADPMGDMIAWYEAEYGLEINYEKMLAGSWILGFPEEHQTMVRERLKSPGFFRHLPVMKDCAEVLREINKRYELFIVSAAMEFPNSLKDKYEWLADYFPFIGWKQIALCGDKKLVHGDHMIDDHIWNLEYFNGKKYIFTAAHNLRVNDFIRINNWAEAAEIFLK